MGKRHRMNGRIRRAMADIKKMRRGSQRLIKKTQHRRGFLSEKEGKKMELYFFENRKIKNFVFVADSSYMNKVLKVDKIWQRLDGAFVPLQFKSTQKYAEEYKNKFKDFLETKFGALPVIVVLSPGDKWEDKAEEVLEMINSWDGNFKFTLEQVKYSKFFDYENHPYFGLSLKIRKKIFFRHLGREKKIQKQKDKIMEDTVSSPA